MYPRRIEQEQEGCTSRARGPSIARVCSDFIGMQLSRYPDADHHNNRQCDSPLDDDEYNQHGGIDDHYTNANNNSSCSCHQ